MRRTGTTPRARLRVGAPARTPPGPPSGGGGNSWGGGVGAFARLRAGGGGYQASLWDGVQSSNYSRAGALRAQGSLDATEANQNRIADLTVVENFVDATLGGDEAMSNFYRER